jgi:hypothetical protein
MLGLNYSILSNSCVRGQFAVVVNAFDMMVYGVYANPIEVGQKPLGQPDCLLSDPNLDAAAPIFRLVDDDLRSSSWFLGHLVCHSVTSAAKSFWMVFMISAMRRSFSKMPAASCSGGRCRYSLPKIWTSRHGLST